MDFWSKMAIFFAAGGAQGWTVRTWTRVAGEPRPSQVTLERVAPGEPKFLVISMEQARQLGMEVDNWPRGAEVTAPDQLAAERAKVDAATVAADKADAKFEGNRAGLADDLTEQSGKVSGWLGMTVGKAVGGAAKLAGSILGQGAAGFILAAWPILLILLGGAIVVGIILWIL